MLNKSHSTYSDGINGWGGVRDSSGHLAINGIHHFPERSGITRQGTAQQGYGYRIFYRAQLGRSVIGQRRNRHRGIKPAPQ